MAGLLEVLQKLDKQNDNHWTADGQPRLETVRMLAGNQSITRAMIDAEVPGFNRSGVTYKTADETVMTVEATPETVSTDTANETVSTDTPDETVATKSNAILDFLRAQEAKIPEMIEQKVNLEKLGLTPQVLSTLGKTSSPLDLSLAKKRA